jgi:hypothetical protein
VTCLVMVVRAIIIICLVYFSTGQDLFSVIVQKERFYFCDIIKT